MISFLLSMLNKTKDAYLALRHNNPVMLSGDYDLNFHLHRKETPENAKNANINGKLSIVLVDVALIAVAISVISLVCGIVGSICRLLKNLF